MGWQQDRTAGRQDGRTAGRWEGGEGGRQEGGKEGRAGRRGGGGEVGKTCCPTPASSLADARVDGAQNTQLAGGEGGDLGYLETPAITGPAAPLAAPRCPHRFAPTFTCPRSGVSATHPEPAAQKGPTASRGGWGQKALKPPALKRRDAPLPARAAPRPSPICFSLVVREIPAEQTRDRVPTGPTAVEQVSRRRVAEITGRARSGALRAAKAWVRRGAPREGLPADRHHPQLTAAPPEDASRRAAPPDLEIQNRRCSHRLLAT